MKKILILSLVLFTLTNCKNEEKQQLEPTTVPLSETAEKVANPSLTECYKYDENGSVIQMNLTNNDNEISGILTYELKEKDSNKGTIKGQIIEDKLIAVYTFQSEGTESIREVAFLIKDNQLIEGYGEIIVEGTNAKFKDINAIKYDSKMPLSKIDCIK